MPATAPTRDAATTARDDLRAKLSIAFMLVCGLEPMVRLASKVDPTLERKVRDAHGVAISTMLALRKALRDIGVPS